MKVKILNGLNWINYNNYCKRNKLKKDNIKSLELFIKGVRDNELWFKI